LGGRVNAPLGALPTPSVMVISEPVVLSKTVLHIERSAAVVVFGGKVGSEVQSPIL
jgi:hypothetical protein